MDKIDINRVIADDYEVRVGNKYEVSPGNWGTMKTPTQALQEKVFGLGDEATAQQLVPLVLDGLKSYDPDDAVFGMEVAVARDFFALLTKIVQRVSTGSTSSEAAAQTAA